MAYVKTTWVDEVTPLSAANLNKLETGVDALYKRRLIYSVTNVNSFSTPVGDINGDTDGPYRITFDGFTIGDQDAAMWLRLTGTDNSNAGSGIWQEVYVDAAGASVQPSAMRPTNDAGLYLFSSRFNLACQVLSEATLKCGSGQRPMIVGQNVIKPMSTADARVLGQSGHGQLINARSVTGLTFVMAASAVNFTGRIIIDKLGVA